MQVRHLTDTYTNLAQLNRGAPGQAEKQEPQVPLDRTGQGDRLAEAEAVERSRIEASNLPPLKTGEALALTGETALRLREAAGSPLLDTLHDLTQVSMITPRYV